MNLQLLLHRCLRVAQTAPARLAGWRRAGLKACLRRAGEKLLYLLTIESRGRPARRSLWAGTPILTLPVKAKAEGMLGVHADSLVYQTYFITDAFKYNLQSLASKGPPWWRKLLPYLVLIWACVRYQRFHYFCDRGILPPTGFLQFNEYELWLLRYLGKEIFFYTYGADIRTQERTRALGEPNCCTECPTPGVCCVCSEELGWANYTRISKYANAVFAMGDMIEYTPGGRHDLFYWPLDLSLENGQRYRPCYPDPDSAAPVRVVHAPNHRSFKGSQYLIQAVAELRAEGVPLELQLVERVPNRQALDIYRQADIVFDQCLIGFHGYFALEAMAMGKPVMAFIRNPRRYLLRPDECPLINARFDQVKEVLRRLATDRRRLHKLGVQGRRYIEACYSLEAFAGRLLQTYRKLGLVGGPILGAEAPPALRRAA
jgi:glycosyltransferase involved in cell wall biosynthesis